MLRFKRARDDRIVKLAVTGDTNEAREGVVDVRYAKFRTNRARVESIEHIMTNESFDKATSIWNSNFIYRVGEEVTVDNYSPNSNLVCAKGIHYYQTREAAVAHEVPRNWTGKWVAWYENGQKLEQGQYENGIAVGEWVRWHYNGQMSQLSNFEYGMQVGEWILWYDNGQKWEQGQYENGKKVGKWVWHKNGQNVRRKRRHHVHDKSGPRNKMTI